MLWILIVAAGPMLFRTKLIKAGMLMMLLIFLAVAGLRIKLVNSWAYETNRRKTGMLMMRCTSRAVAQALGHWGVVWTNGAKIKSNQNFSNPWASGAQLGLMGRSLD